MWKNEGEDSLSGTSGVAGELFASAFGLAPVTTKCAQLGWLDSKSPSFVSTLAKRHDRIVSLPVLFRDVLDGTMIKKTKKKQTKQATEFGFQLTTVGKNMPVRFHTDVRKALLA